MNSHFIVNTFAEIDEKIRSFVSQSEFIDSALPDCFKNYVLDYILRPGKRLRPSLFFLSYGCAGGKSNDALTMPVAVSLELFHTWTLIHDDLIDNAQKRRGKISLHEQWASDTEKNLDISPDSAKSYGRNAAMLLGDMLHGLSSSIFLNSIDGAGCNHELIIALFHYLQSNITGGLAQGELLDIQYGLQEPAVLFSKLSEEDLLEVAKMKSGLLFQFCAIAGASLGIGRFNLEDKCITALADFALRFGIAYQLKDDINDIIKDDGSTGKDCGSDIREGKMTPVIFSALQNADHKQKELIFSALRNPNLSDKQLKDIANLIVDLGGVKRANELIRIHVDKALALIDSIKGEANYKTRLREFIQYLI